MSYNVKWIDSNITVSFEGNVTYYEILKLNEEIYGDSRFDSMQYQLIDFSKMDNIIVSEKETHIISKLEVSASRWNNNIKIAMVTTNEIAIQLIEEYKKELSTTNWDIRVFSNLNEAQEWCTEKVSKITTHNL